MNDINSRMTTSREFGKLVRSRIPEIIRKTGSHPVVRVLDRVERRAALMMKLREEVDELSGAMNRKEVLDEAADVYEVLIAIVTEAGYFQKDIESIAKNKRLLKGDFEAGIWLEKIED